MSVSFRIYSRLIVALLNTAITAGFTLSGENHPLDSDNMPLKHFVLVKNPDAGRVLVLTAGLHGVEGYAGVEMITRWLKEHGKNIPPNLRVVICPNLNPWGMAHGRRVNAQGVDLNRNFLRWGNESPPSNDGYGGLHDDLLPVWGVPGSVQLWKDAEQRLEAERRHNMRAYIGAVTGGQYTHPDGLFYGGNCPAPENVWLRKVIMRDVQPDARYVAHLDIHTGIGKWAEGEVIIPIGAGHSMYGHLKRVFGDKARSPFGDDQSVSAPVSGCMNGAFLDHLNKARLTSCAIEFGTHPISEGESALRIEQAWRNAGAPESSDGLAAQQRLIEHFYPRNRKWRAVCYKQFQAVVAELIGHVMS